MNKKVSMPARGGSASGGNKELPKAYEPSKYEDRIYQNWEKSGFFQPEAGQPLADNLKAETFSITLPPPNRTGVLHIGHALMLVVQDILIRYNRMQGKKTLWVPGTDHAAIATQSVVEKKLYKEEEKTRHDLGREEFLKRVREFAEQSHKTITRQVKKMGASLDWSREAYTLDEVRNRAVNTVFKMMYDDGLIYRGDRVVNWCPRCHSTLADDEVEYKAQKAKLCTFKYSKDFPFTIATTRPETKLGDTAVAVNPKDKRYKKYINKIFTVDFVGVPLKLKIIADRQVDMEFGTGAVGVTPAHSMVDWQMAQEHELEVVKVINEDGNIVDNLADYSGKPVEQAREMIVKKLKEQGLLEKEEEMENNLSLCYRCHTPIEPLPSLQWFISVNKKIPKYNKSIKELSIEAVKKGVFGKDKIRIIPERFEKNYFHWMDDLRDWCISRQIWFGHRVPVWYRRMSDVGCRMSEINKEEEIYVGVEAPKGKGWEQDPDTLDTWFSSGLWTFSTLANSPDQIKIKDGKLIIDSEDFKNFHPTSVMETGYDILFFWVARMIIMTTYAVGDIPFQNVYLHGLVRDEKGRKMSKSLGNAIDPLDVCAKYGTDAVRLSLIIGTTPGNDINLSEEKIAGFRNFTNKLWNISRYVLQATENSEQNIDINFNNLTLADKYILSKLEDSIKHVTEDLENYRFSSAGERLREFTWSNLADWHLEATKFQKGTETQKVLLYVLRNLLKLWHPFMPFVTEVIWKEFNNSDLIIEKWPESEYNGKEAVQLMTGAGGFQLLQNIIIKIRNARVENGVDNSKKIAAVIIPGINEALIEYNQELIKGLKTGIKEIKIKESGDEYQNEIHIRINNIANDIDNNIDIYLVDAIDKEKEKIRIKKEIENLEKLIVNTEKKLSNKQFVKKAPKQIVKQEKEKLGLWQTELKKLKEQLKNLK